MFSVLCSSCMPIWSHSALKYSSLTTICSRFFRGNCENRNTFFYYYLLHSPRNLVAKIVDLSRSSASSNLPYCDSPKSHNANIGMRPRRILDVIFPILSARNVISYRAETGHLCEGQAVTAKVARFHLIFQQRTVLNLHEFAVPNSCKLSWNISVWRILLGQECKRKRTIFVIFFNSFIFIIHSIFVKLCIYDILMNSRIFRVYSVLKLFLMSLISLFWIYWLFF